MIIEDNSINRTTMTTIQTVLETIKDNNIKFINLRFTDSRGVWHHFNRHAANFKEKDFSHGIAFDGSSIAGWRGIQESDLVLMPDPTSAVIDPFASQATLIMCCDVALPDAKHAYNRDPRTIAKRAEEYLKTTEIASDAFFGPEAEFFIFDDVRFYVGKSRCYYEINATENPDGEINGHKPRPKEGYLPTPPVDSGQDMRCEMVTLLHDMGITMEKHHHEVAPSQHELGIRYASLTKMADNLQLYKYVVKMVAHSYGKTATFMPKPILNDNGSGLHVHQSLWSGKTNLFAGDSYAGLSEMALFYIGGIFKHARALNAFTNPTTNSYKRLVPGFEAPVLLAYSQSNRSASCRIPYVLETEEKRVEVRFPDPAANPYLAFTALLMAGLDGIQNKIHPKDAVEENLYTLPYERLKQIPTVCGSLREALIALNEDREFLKQGNVMSDDLIDAYLELKWEEVYTYEHTPHPVEYQMYYSV